MISQKKIWFFIIIILITINKLYENQSDPDEELGNSALIYLHKLAYFTANYQEATKDDDQFGCYHSYKNIQKMAHKALVKMNLMSFPPRDAVQDVSKILHISQLTPNQCSNKIYAQIEFMISGESIVALRYDYAIGGRKWYKLTRENKIEAENPLEYARSLKDKNYSWVSVRPKGMIFMIETDWKAEAASSQIDDPAIENSGNNLKAVEVDYRRVNESSTKSVYFYRTKAEAETYSKND